MNRFHRFCASAIVVTGVATALVFSTTPASSTAAPLGSFAPAFGGSDRNAQFRGIRLGLSPAARGIAGTGRAPNLHDLGQMRGNAPVEIGVIMRFRHEPELAALTLAQSQRSSPYFHRYLTPAQFTNYFAPDAATYARTIATLQRRGFRITQTFANRSAIRATSTAVMVERYFHTQLHSYYQTGHGMRHMNVTPAVIPQELRDTIVSVAGLHNAVSVRFPIRFAKQQPRVRRMNVLAKLLAAKRNDLRTSGRSKVRSAASAAPTPITTSTPSVGPGPDATEVPNSITTEGVVGGGYDPTVFAAAYDYPVDHGYGGRNHVAGSVIDNDYLDSDEAAELSSFGITRTGGLGHRVCTNPNAAANCDGTIGAADPEGESTLDAETILSLAPAAQFYEYLTPDASDGLNDLGLEFAYERVISDDVVDVVNSSFGGCETDDPDGNYAYNYIAMEGASLGITFSASTGDTGSGNCGQYVTNGAPQTETNASSPSSDYYFTAVGGTDFFQLTSCTAGTLGKCYTHEDAWTFGGGGYSVYEPLPAWQSTVVAAQADVADTSTAGRNTPDLVFTADPDPPGNAMMLVYNGAATSIGGTSLSSPMWTAMQTEINQVQNTRNGWINPALYAIYYAQNCAATSPCTDTTAFAFNDVIGGANGRYQDVAGFNDAVGLGSPNGWELAGSEYGTPGATAAPVVTPSPSPTPGSATPTATPTSTPSSVASIAPTPHASGTAYAVTTIAGSMCATASMSVDGNGNAACFDGPTGIAYDPASTTSENTQSTTDNYLFVTDYNTGFLRSIDVTASATPVVSENLGQWSAKDALVGIGYFPAGADQATFGGLYVMAAGDPPGAETTTQTGGNVFEVDLPTTPKPTATAAVAVNGVTAPGGVAFNNLGSETAITSVTDGDEYVVSYGGAVNDNTTATSTLPTKGNYGITYFPVGANNAGLAEFYVVDSGAASISTVTDTPEDATVTALTSGAPLKLPKGIVYVSATNAFYVANCGGNNILRVTSSGTVTIVAGDGAATEGDGYNTGAAFSCPFGITTDNASTSPSLYVTDFNGNTIRKITNLN